MRHPVAATPPDRRRAAQRSLKRVAPALELPQERGRAARGAPVARSIRRQRSRVVPRSRLREAARSRPAARGRSSPGRPPSSSTLIGIGGSDRSFEMSVGQSRNHQAQIDQIELDRIKPLARFGQDVEAVLEMASEPPRRRRRRPRRPPRSPPAADDRRRIPRNGASAD